MVIQLQRKKILQGKLQRVIIQVTTPKNLLTKIEVANIRILPCTQLQQNLLINKTTHLQSNWTPCRRFLLCRNLLSTSNSTTISDCCSLSAKFFYEPVATQYGTLDAQMCAQIPIQVMSSWARMEFTVLNFYSLINREELNQISSFSKYRQSHGYLGTCTTIFLEQFLKLIYCVFIESIPLKYNYKNST